MSVGAFPVSRDRSEFAGKGRSEWLDLILRLDFIMVLAVLAVTGFGLLVLWGGTNAIPHLANTAVKQSVFLCLALVAMLATVMVDYRWINRAALGLYVLNMLALVAVLVIGTRVNSAKSWIALGPFNWQPSETMKIATVLVCAQWQAIHPDRARGWQGFLVPGLICGLPALLILMQPDFGTAALFFGMFLLMMLMAGASKRWLAIILVGTALGFVSVYPFLKPYQKARIQVFLDPAKDPRGRGYHVTQSKIAIGAGGLIGQGLGGGTQTTLRFLPEHHTDFIFASTVEQFGMLGALALLGGYAVILMRILHVMDVARDRFGGLVAAGLAAIFLGHVVQNIGMTMGMMPVTGIPLPLMSYGGSFLITTFVLIGLVLNVGSRRFTFIR